MLKKFSISYIAMLRCNTRIFTHLTDDPVEVEGFLMHSPVAGAPIKKTRHNGQTLSGRQFDKRSRLAVEHVASLRLRESLGLDAEEIKDRSGIAA